MSSRLRRYEVLLHPHLWFFGVQRGSIASHLTKGRLRLLVQMPFKFLPGTARNSAFVLVHARATLRIMGRLPRGWPEQRTYRPCAADSVRSSRRHGADLVYSMGAVSSRR